MKMLKFVKTFEDMETNDTVPVIDLNSKNLKFKWKRASTMRYERKDLRAYYCTLNGIDIGGVYNASQGHFSKDDTNQWYIMYTSRGNNIVLKKKFELYDINDAKNFFEEAYISILNSTPEKENQFKMKENILALNRFALVYN